MMYICKNYGTYIGSTSSETNSSNINCGIDVTNNPTLDKLYNVHEIQYSHLYKQNNVVEKELWQIPETIIRSWGAEILSALEALHQQDILIFDFKPDNILLDDTGHIRLTYIVPQHNRRLSKLIYPYSSPESIIFSPTILVTSATDIWSFGIILYELLTGIVCKIGYLIIRIINNNNLYSTFISQAFVAKHPRLFHSHSIINIPTKLSENAKSLLHGVSLIIFANCNYKTHYNIIILLYCYIYYLYVCNVIVIDAEILSRRTINNRRNKASSIFCRNRLV